MAAGSEGMCSSLDNELYDWPPEKFSLVTCLSRAEKVRNKTYLGIIEGNHNQKILISYKNTRI